MRKSPIQHQVSGYFRGELYVRPYTRGNGFPRSREHVVVGGVEEEEEQLFIDYPVVGEIVDKDVEWEERDYDDEVDRPTAFRFVIKTKDDVYDQEDKAWMNVAEALFDEFDDTMKDGYALDKVVVKRDLRFEDDDTYGITVWMRRVKY